MKEAKNWKNSKQELKNYNTKPFRTDRNNSTSLTHLWIYHHTTEPWKWFIIRENSAYHERLKLDLQNSQWMDISLSWEKGHGEEGRMEINLKGGVKGREVLKFMPQSLKHFIFLFDHHNFLNYHLFFLMNVPGPVPGIWYPLFILDPNNHNHHFRNKATDAEKSRI